MAYGEYLEERINNVLSERQIQFDARKMMGGLCYMIDDKMYFGIIKSDLMARILVDAYEELIEREGRRPMDSKSLRFQSNDRCKKKRNDS
tara:strand:+ start:2156 stop:2425 length:270 start_codon:yes stop_codon:yes gene_type:complete